MTNIKIIIREYKTSIRFVIACTVIFLIGASIYAWVQPEMYKATTSMLVRSEQDDMFGKKQTTSSVDDMPISLPYKDYAGYFKSRNLSIKLLEKKEILNAYAEFDGISADKIDRNKLWKRVADSVSVKDPGKGIIYLDYVGPTQEIASSCANGYVDVFIAFFNETINADINSSISYLEEQKGVMEAKIGEVDDRIMTLQRDHKVLDIQSESKRIINDYASAKVDLLDAEIKLMAVEGSLGGIEDNDVVSHDSELIKDPVLSVLRKKLMTLKMNYDELSNFFKDDSEELSNIRSKMNEIEKQIAEYVDADLSLSKDIKQDQIEFMKEYMGDIESRMYMIPDLSNTLTTLERTRAVYEKLIAFLEEKLAQENMNKAKRISKFVILDRADPSEARYVSRFMVIPLIGALAGALIGMFLVYIYVKIGEFVKNL